MAQQLTVKAYLKRWNPQLGRPEGTDEIRRFAVDYDVSTSFEYLMAKITNVFPGLVNKSVTLYWKDADSDMIAFSSDDELMEAMKSVNDGLFRVFIAEKASTAMPPQQQQQQSSSTGLLHFGITCDGCEGPVHGVRYKCEVCPDYDLCSGCKATGLHSQHEMRTINTPVLPWPICGEFAAGFGGHPFGPHHMPPPPPPPPSYGSCATPPPPFPTDDNSGPCNLAEMRKMHRRAWKRWYRATYGEDHKRKHKKEKKEKKKLKEDEKKEQKASDGGHKSSDSSSSDSESGEASPATEYLKTVGDSVAAMLDPLGIDVEVDVETRGQRQRCHRGRFGMRGGGWGWGCPGMRRGGTASAAGGFGPWGMRSRCGFDVHNGPWNGMRARWGSGGGCPMRPQPEQQQPQQKQQMPAQPSANSSTLTEPSVPNVKPSGPVNPSPCDASDIPQMPGVPHHDPDTNSETGEMASGHFIGSSEQDWMIVNEAAAPLADVEEATAGVEQLHMSAAEAASSSFPMATLYPSIPDCPKIAEALEQMMAMGYSNDGGWLTSLLVAHDGDIGRALDAIHVKK